MNIKEYQENAKRTNATLSKQVYLEDGVTTRKCLNLSENLHMVLGMQTESAEIADVFKKHLAYGKEIDEVNLKEEIGDLLWYIANMCEINNWDIEEIMSTNIAKLKVRYPEKFTSDKALNRNLEEERKTLE